MAEGLYNHLSKTNSAESAGNEPYTARVYNKPHREAIEVMQEIGIDISEQKVRLVTSKMIEEADKIYVLCKKEECLPFLLKEGKDKITFWNIPDPYGLGISHTRKVRDMIKGKVEEII